MKVSDFDYELPGHLIAQTPAEPRDSSRLMLLDRDRGCIAHHRFSELGSFLRPGDVLVLNDTRVMPARLAATKRITGGKAEILLLRQLDSLRWLTLVRGRSIRVGAGLRLNGSDITAEVVEERTQGQRVLRFSRPLKGELEVLGPDSLCHPTFRPILKTMNAIKQSTAGTQARQLRLPPACTSQVLCLRVFSAAASCWPAAPCTSAWTRFCPCVLKTWTGTECTANTPG